MLSPVSAQRIWSCRLPVRLYLIRPAKNVHWVTRIRLDLITAVVNCACCISNAFSCAIVPKTMQLESPAPWHLITRKHLKITNPDGP
jgi:hypothetical protein